MAPKKIIIFVTIFFIVIGISGGLGYYLTLPKNSTTNSEPSPNTAPPQASSNDKTVTDSVNVDCSGLYLPKTKRCIALEKADTDEKRLKGLSDREQLNNDSGMLFIFDRPSEQCFWMKDMKFAIDMIWLDQDRKIIKIEEKVSPASYPASFCAEKTKYVIELNSGEASKESLTLGTQLKF